LRRGRQTSRVVKAQAIRLRAFLETAERDGQDNQDQDEQYYPQ
jgi:hypothetical protein